MSKVSHTRYLEPNVDIHQLELKLNSHLQSHPTENSKKRKLLTAFNPNHDGIRLYSRLHVVLDTMPQSKVNHHIDLLTLSMTIDFKYPQQV